MIALLRDERAVSMVEYALVLAFVAIVAIVALTAFGLQTCNVVRELDAPTTFGNY